MENQAGPSFSPRPATDQDLAALLAIESNVQPPSGWTEAGYREEMTKPFSNTLLLTDDDTDQTVAAYIVFWVLFKECHILNVAVHPDWRGLGHAKRLVRLALDQALKKGVERAYLEVRKSNDSAVMLYQKMGFFIDHVKPRFYSDGEDAYFMQIFFNKSNEL